MTATSPSKDEHDVRRRLRRLERSVQRYMDRGPLWPEDGRLLVGVSGGPDSSALLVVLARLAPDRGLGLTAAHFDHQLRDPAASERDREAVERLSQTLGVELICGGADVRSLARESRLSLEEGARRARYEFLAQAAARAGARFVAVGHTADDQAETVLLHILRGAGLTGIAGMTPRSRWPAPGHADLTLVRPLLGLTREDTAWYCEANGVEPVEDLSNRSSAFLRNRIRNDLLPQLGGYNPAIKAALARLADAARADLAYIESVASTAVEVRGDGVRLSRDLLRAWPDSLRRHAIRLAFLALLGDLQGVGEPHVRAIEDAALDASSGRELDLPRGVHAVVARDGVELHAGTPEADALPAEPVELSVPGVTRFGPLEVAAGRLLETEGWVTCEVDAEAAGRRLTLRRRRPGDRFQPIGLAGTKKLQDYFVDEHVPRRERDSVLIVEAEGGVIWVGGRRIADWAKVRPGSPSVAIGYRSRDAR